MLAALGVGVVGVMGRRAMGVLKTLDVDAACRTGRPVIAALGQLGREAFIRDDQPCGIWQSLLLLLLALALVSK